MFLYNVRNRWDDRLLCATDLTWVNDGRASCLFSTFEDAQTAAEAYLSQHGDDRGRVYVDDYEFEPDHFLASTKPLDYLSVVKDGDDLTTLISDLHLHYESLAAEQGESEYAQDVYIYTTLEDVWALLTQMSIEGVVGDERSDFEEHNVWNKTQLGLK